MNKLVRFIKDRRGVAAVEMALITPFLAGFVLVSAAIWDLGMRKQDMHGPLKLAAQYYMNGGQNDTAARSIALTSWQRKPENATFQVERLCRCGQATQTCGVLCADSTPPAVFVRLTATATDPDAMVYPNQSSQELVRVR